jgi:S-adenosylmethionine hydrolase
VSGKLEGKIVAISDEGNLVTDIKNALLQNAPTDERIRIRCDEHETVGLFDADHGQPEATLLAMRGSGGTLELAIVGMSARAMLGVRVGEVVVVEWT